MVPGVELASCAVAAARRRQGLPSAGGCWRAVWAFAVMHLSWGTGFLIGRRRNGRMRPTDQATDREM